MMSRLWFLSLAFLASTLVLGFAPLASRAVAADKASESDKTAFDKRFVKEAAEYSMAENEISRLARDRSKSEGVKHYAEIVIGGQKKLLEELRDVAKGHDYNIPDELTEKQKSTRERLSKLDGTDFDVQYMSDQVEDQQAMVDLFQKASTDCQDENLRKFADRKLSSLKEHLDNAKELYRKVKNKER